MIKLANAVTLHYLLLTTVLSLFYGVTWVVDFSSSRQTLKEYISTGADLTQQEEFWLKVRPTLGLTDFLFRLLAYSAVYWVLAGVLFLGTTTGKRTLNYIHNKYLRSPTN